MPVLRQPLQPHRSITFPDGSTFVTNNRCPRGEIVGAPEQPRRARSAQAGRQQNRRRREPLRGAPEAPVPGLAHRAGRPDRHISHRHPPRAGVFGHHAVLEHAAAHAQGSPSASAAPPRAPCSKRACRASRPTLSCFPAKLVHGHILDLARAGVDRIFMPIITTVPSENAASTSISMCAVVKGYPMVVKSWDDLRGALRASRLTRRCSTGSQRGTATTSSRSIWRTRRHSAR